MSGESNIRSGPESSGRGRRVSRNWRDCRAVKPSIMTAGMPMPPPYPDTGQARLWDHLIRSETTVEGPSISVT